MIALEGSPQGLNYNYIYPWNTQEHHMKSGLNSKKVYIMATLCRGLVSYVHFHMARWTEV